MYIYTMENIMNIIESELKYKLDNIEVIDNTVCKESTVLQEEYKPVEIPIDPNMKLPGSVIGELIYEPGILTDAEFQRLELRNYIMKVKLVALDIMDKPLFSNPKDMRNKDREILIKTCEEVMEKFTPDQITEKFNHIICRDVLTPTSDISTLPIYSNKLNKI